MSRKVLVVDDEKLIVKGIRFSLEQDGMDVDCAYDGEEALKLIRENKYNIILLDVMLPKLDGFQVCQQVREFSDVPIVMLTAKGEDMDKILGLEYGADDYITKPFAAEELVAEALTEAPERVADRGLRDVQALGDGGHAPQFVEHHEGAQLVQIGDRHLSIVSMDHALDIYSTICTTLLTI